MWYEEHYSRVTLKEHLSHIQVDVLIAFSVMVCVFVHDIEDEDAKNENEKTLLLHQPTRSHGHDPPDSLILVSVKRSSVPRYPSFPYHPLGNRYTTASRI